MVEAALPIGHSLVLRLEGEMRRGPVAALDGTDLVTVAAGGLEWWPGPPRRVGLGARGDLLVLRHAVTGNAMGVTETQTRLQPGADLLAVVRVRLASRFEISFGVGLELAFGATALRTGPTSRVVAVIPALAAISHIGLRVGL
jgi:hypothetical protein